MDRWPQIRLNTDLTSQVQNEQQVAVSPVNPLNLVAVWRDFRLGYRQVGVGVSHDGGYTWTDSLLQNVPYVWVSDPGITVSRDGTFYLVVLGFISTSQPNGLFVFRSATGGETWEGPFTVVDGVAGAFEDKELIACDRTEGPFSGFLYVPWARFTSGSRIVVSRSTDGGASWSAPVNVSSGSYTQWPVAAVGPNGEVYIAWVDLYSGIRLDVSLDGGSTWGTDRLVTATDGYGAVNGGIDVFTFPAMDIDITDGPRRGTMYMAFMDWTAGYSETDLYFIKSTDGGATWSNRLRLNDDPLNNGCDQFHPWLCVDSSGMITVIWLDRRLDSGNLFMDCYMTQSIDGGVNWNPNTRISTVSSDPTAGSRAGLIGEYIGLTTWNGRVNPIWTDTRLGNQDTFGSVIQPFATATPTPATTPTASWTAGPSATPSPPPLPSNTPAPSETAAVTATATATPTIAPSRTATPTATPSRTASPSPTPTIPPIPSPTEAPCNPQIDLRLNATRFTAGDRFHLEAAISPGGRPDCRFDEYIILDVLGEYWFWPSWSTGGDARLDTYADNELEFILDFIWPDGAGSLSGIKFWGALTDVGSVNLFSWDVVEWEYD